MARIKVLRLIRSLKQVYKIHGNIEVRIQINGHGSMLKDDELHGIQVTDMWERVEPGKPMVHSVIVCLLLEADETEDEWLDRMGEELIEEHDDAN
jgi:hypothetical protein